MPPAAPPADSGPPTRHPDYLWVGVVTTGTLAAATAITGLLALKAKSDADTDASQFGVSASTLQDANSQKHTLAAVSDVLLGTTVVAGGVTLYFALKGPSGSARKGTRDGLSVSFGPGAISFRAGF
jgi:hypothetical protein